MKKIENLEERFDDYVLNTFGESFSFRPQQREVILDIVNSFLYDTKNLYLLDAPTGSGKSIIAIVTAGFLSSFGMKGYMLASDLSLQTQYEKNVELHGLDWGSVKGVDNYDCAVNGEKFSLGDCRFRNLSYDACEKLPCFSECGYLFNRKKAIESPVSILNYSYWLTQRNYVEEKMKERTMAIPFTKRDFTFCDEAHKIVEIVQNHFSPRIDETIYDKLDDMKTFVKSEGISQKTPHMKFLKNTLKSLESEENKKVLFSHMKDLELILVDFIDLGVGGKEYVSKTFGTKISIPKKWRFFLSLCDFVKDVHCKVEDYNHILSTTGYESMIKNSQDSQIVFNCMDESYLMTKHFHDQAGFKLLMTATMGNPKTFLKNIGASDARYFKIDNRFDFEKSPIYLYPSKRMSMSKKEKNMPWMVKNIEKILDENSNNRGIIHTGSYEIAEKIFISMDPVRRKRILMYKGKNEKREALSKFSLDENSIIMGPSLLEGLDFFDDTSRFQIFVKVPFPYLGDKFIKAKFDEDKEWYDWKTSCGMLQGTGRSIRNENDWAVTYILDGCFVDLLNRARLNFPEEFLGRIKIVK